MGKQDRERLIQVLEINLAVEGQNNFGNTKGLLIRSIEYLIKQLNIKDRGETGDDNKMSIHHESE